jgi:RimJ/RimL family protein N-acetyltransferase
MIIRAATIDDAEQLLSLQNQLDNETTFMLYEPGERNRTLEEQTRYIKQHLDEQHSTILLAEHEQRLVGYLSATGASLQRIRHTVYIVIGILQAFTGQGIGTQLFVQLEQWARQQQIHRLELTVMTNNQAGIALYKKMGFTIEGLRKDACVVNNTYVDEYYMAKLLD